MGTSNVVKRVAEPAFGRLTLAVADIAHGVDGPEFVTRLLESVPGVARAYFNGDTEMAYVEYRKSEVTPGRLLSTLEQAGLSVGDVTIRSAMQGEALGPQSDRSAWNSASLTSGAEESMTDDHSCCGPTPAEQAAIGESPALPTANDAPARGLTGATQVHGGWSFKVRMGLFLTAALLVIGPALWLVRPMASNAMGAEYSVNMSMTGFTPPNFSVPAGKPVSLELNNVDSPFHGVINGALHQFAIDKLGIDVRLDGKQSTIINLPALEPGTYEFYCNVCCGGKVNPSMRGTLTVEGMEGVSQR